MILLVQVSKASDGEDVMKTTDLTFTTITMIVAILAAVPLRAAVKVTPTEPPNETTEPPKTEPPQAESSQGKPFALQVDETLYASATEGGGIRLIGPKIGSRQTFWITDLDGGDIMDGDKIKILYIPGSGNPGSGRKGDVTKASYWVETAGGVRRTKEGSAFKLKKVGAKYALRAPSGKFVTGTTGDDGGLLLSDKQEGAMLVKFIDLSAGKPKPSEKPKTEVPAAEKPAAQ
jgi:hypothetical protein